MISILNIFSTNLKQMLPQQSDDQPIQSFSFMKLKLNGCYAYRCQNCGKQLRNRNEMKVHCEQRKCGDINRYRMKINNKQQKIYSCKCCQKQLKNVTQMKKHVLSCEPHKDQFQNNEEMQYQQNYVQEKFKQVRSKFTQSQKIKNKEDKYQNLEYRISKLEVQKKNIRLSDLSEIGQSYIINQQAQLISKQLSQLFYAISKPMIQQTLTSSLQANIDIVRAKENLQINLINQIEQLNYDSSIDDFKTNLQKHWNILNTQCELKKKDGTTISRYKKGYAFWNQYSKRNIQYMIKIVEDLRALNDYDLRCAIQFYNSMRRISTHLFTLKQLPQVVYRKNRILKKQYQKIDLDQVKNQVYFLINQQKYQLATDLWMCSTMGLRKNQLQKIFFKVPNNKICQSILVVEHKNKHKCCRIIPNSLKIMLTKYDIKFPLGKNRLKNVRKFCIDKFKRFYGLRGMYITSVISAVLQKDQFHHNLSTTIKHYLNENNKRLINKMFELNHKQLLDFAIQQSGIQLQFTNQGYEYHQLNNNKVELTVEYPDYYEDQIKDVVMLESENWNDIQDSQLKKEIKIQSKCFKDLNIQFQTQKYTTIVDAVLSKISNQDIEKDILEYSDNSYEKRQSEAVVIENFKQVFNIEPIIIDQSNIQKITTEENNTTSEDNFIILKINNQDPYYKISDNSLNLSSNQEARNFLEQRLRKKQKNKKYLQDQAFLTLRHPKCKCGQILDWIECNVNHHYILQCSKTSCKPNFHQCFPSSQINFNATIKVININIKPKQIQVVLKPAIFKSKQNNVAAIIQSEQRIYSNKLIYRDNIPQIIQTKLDFATDIISQLIEQNRQKQKYLPIIIKKTMIGYSVVADDYIEQNTLIATYIGEVCTNQNITNKNDSLFRIGWIRSHIHVAEFIYNSVTYANVGRYFNTSLNPQTSNCTASVILHNSSISSKKKSEPVYQIAVIIKTNKRIKPNEHLVFYYGNQYLLSQQMKQIEFKNINEDMIKEGDFMSIKKLNKKIKKLQLKKIIQETSSKNKPKKKQ